MKRTEKPGIQTPWAKIDQLLAADERFEVIEEDWRGIILAPKNVSKLSALFYLLKEYQQSFQLMGKGHEWPAITQRPFLFLSARAFQHCEINQSGIVAIGAGCDAKTVYSDLWQRGYEIVLEEDMETEFKRSIASICLRGREPGVILQGKSLRERLIGAEIVTSGGSVIRLGRSLKSAFMGPAIHQILWGTQYVQALMTQLFFEVSRRPAYRLYLNWTFKSQQKAWEHFDRLEQKVLSWERLDCVISGRAHEQQFILAQISGSEEEIQAFENICPEIEKASRKDLTVTLRDYLKLQGYFRRIFSRERLCAALSASDYIWYHGLTQQGWLVTSSASLFKQEPVPIPQWQNELNLCLSK